MLDSDLATLYGVETRVLNQAVKRNSQRFPEDFMFKLTKEECLRSQIVSDVNGNIVGGMDEENNIESQQIILADVPDNSNIANVSDGTWIYWIEPDQMKNMDKIPEMVRVELYRVNNALTNEGQRLVSDSLFETVPDKLPAITLNGN